MIITAIKRTSYISTEATGCICILSVSIALAIIILGTLASSFYRTAMKAEGKLSRHRHYAVIAQRTHCKHQFVFNDDELFLSDVA